MGFLSDAADATRVFLNSAAMGAPQWADRHLPFGNPTAADYADQQVAQARANTGTVGNVASVLGYVAPVAAELKGAKAAFTGLRAAPRMIGAGMDAVQAMLPQSANAIARSRLGLEALPTMSENVGRALSGAGGNVVSAIKNNKILTGLTGLGVAGALAQGSGGPAATASPVKQAVQAKAAAVEGGSANSSASPTSADASANPALDLIRHYAAANGGKISLRELGALSDVGYKLFPRQSTKTSVQETMGNTLLMNAQAILNNNLAHADQLEKTDPAQAQTVRLGAMKDFDENIGRLYTHGSAMDQQTADMIAAARAQQGD